MQPPAPPSPPDAVVERLRAAGCVFAEDEAALLRAAAASEASLATLVDRRVAGQPLEHVIGWADFCGRRVAVDPGVFVPRPRSGFIVDLAVGLVTPGAVVVDLCCGSGAIGLAIAAAVEIELHAVDVDARACACAHRNVAPVGGRVHHGDLYEPLPPTLRGRVDLVVVNAPYVPTAELALLPRDVRSHEPRRALDGGADGLDVHRRVVAQAPRWLAPGGRLLIEVGAHQAPAIAAAIQRAGMAASTRQSDELDCTAVVGTPLAGAV